uniref:Uncharacterized protein n=1 Tax=viral metagenome TaxID=1070528 RepID=A0A6C0I9S7_9ZZZZ
MDSDLEDEYSEPESVDSSGELSGYESLDESQENVNTERIKTLLSDKYYLILELNGGKIDPELFKMELSKINKSLESTENIEITNEEIEFSALLDESSKKVDPETLNKLKKAYNTIYNSQTESVPEKSTADNDILDILEYYQDLELNELKNLIKRLKLKLRIPSKSDPKFEEKWKIFWELIIPYLPSYKTKLNITKPGISTYEVKSVYTYIKEDLKNAKNDNILNEKDKAQIKELESIKNNLLSMEKSNLIDCIVKGKDNYIQVDNYIDKLFNKKIHILKFYHIPVTTTKEPRDIKDQLTSILIGLEYPKEKLPSNINDLEKILIEKYSIPPSMYYNKTFESVIPFEPRNLTFKYNSRTPIVIVKKAPVPANVKLDNTDYYESFLPITNELYSKLHGKNSKNVEYIWVLLYKIENTGKYIFRKFTDFNEYLTELKKKLTDTDQIYQIEQYLQSGLKLPPLKYRKNQIPGIDFVADWQRKLAIRKLKNIDIEKIIFRISNGDVQSYYNKLNNVIFLLKTYPEIIPTLNTYEKLYSFVLFERYNKPTIEERIKTIDLLKKSLDIPFKYKLIGNVIITKKAKQIELLLYDLTDNYNLTAYNLTAYKLSNIIKQMGPRTILNFTNEKLIILIRNVNVNYELLTRKQKPKTVIQPLQESVNYKSFSIKELEALISQENLKLNRLRGNDLKNVKKKIAELKKTVVSKILLITRVKRALLKRKKVPTRVEIKKYHTLNENLIFEVIQAYKRKLITDNYKTHNLIISLELYDLNDLYYKLNYIDKPVYENIKKNIKLENELNYYFMRSLKELNDYLKLNEIADITEILEYFPENYISQNKIVDYYGNDLFLQLYNNMNPVNFYNEKLQRQYNNLISKFTIKPEEPDKYQMVLYNPSTRKFGKNAYDGYLFKVYRLEKNLKTGLPGTVEVTREVEHPRLGTRYVVREIIEKPGNTYYIKLPIINPQNPNDNFRWVEVPTSAVGMYPLNYDTCSRFNKNESECVKSVGISGSKCVYSGDKCVAEYSLKK